MSGRLKPDFLFYPPLIDVWCILQYLRVYLRTIRSLVEPVVMGFLPTAEYTMLNKSVTLWHFSLARCPRYDAIVRLISFFY